MHALSLQTFALQLGVIASNIDTRAPFSPAEHRARVRFCGTRLLFGEELFEGSPTQATGGAAANARRARARSRR